MMSMEIQFERNAPEFWKNIYLIGYMGVGKSSTAKCLSEILEMPVIELDQVIEDYCKKTIPEIFDDIGEEGFRSLETLLLATSITGSHVPYDLLKGAIFSCGGGVPLSDVNVIAMQNSGIVVWLNASPEEVFKRLSKEKPLDDSTNNPAESDGDITNGRPLLRGKMNLTDIQEMMALREPYYEDAADLEVFTDKKTPADVAGEIVLALDLAPNIS